MERLKWWHIALLIIFLATIYFLFFRHTEERKETQPKVVSKEIKECPYTYVSWNMENFGAKKSQETIDAMARIVCKRADLIAAQEITAGRNVGAQAVAKLAQSCSSLGAEWDYIVSDPTSPPSPGIERYAYLWRKDKFTLNRDKAHLVQELADPIDREPFTITIIPKESDAFQVFTMHAVPTEKNPIIEVQALETSHELKTVARAIFSGDFNLDKHATDPSFTSLGFDGYIDEPTSLKQKVNGNHYKVKQYDNIYTKGIRVCSSGTIDFVQSDFSPVTNESLKEARKLSDHLPVFATFR